MALDKEVGELRSGTAALSQSAATIAQLEADKSLLQQELAAINQASETLQSEFSQLQVWPTGSSSGSA